MSEVAVTLPPASTSVPAARRFLQDALDGWGADGFSWTATQILSELATNAVLHAGTSFTVTLTLSGDVLRLAVTDSSARSPRERHYGLEATTGRGVQLVAALSRTWGVDAEPGGKTVWCDLEAGSEPGDGLDADEALLAFEAWGALDDVDGWTEPSARLQLAPHAVARHRVSLRALSVRSASRFPAGRPCRRAPRPRLLLPVGAAA